MRERADVFVYEGEKEMSTDGEDLTAVPRWIQHVSEPEWKDVNVCVCVCVCVCKCV